jgi:hypothetical protein
MKRPALPDGVDAAVQRVEAAGAAAPLHLVARHPERPELVECDDLVLP